MRWEQGIEGVSLSPCCFVPGESHIILMYYKLTVSQLPLLVTTISLAARDGGATNGIGGFGRMLLLSERATFTRRNNINVVGNIPDLKDLKGTVCKA